MIFYSSIFPFAIILFLSIISFNGSICLIKIISNNAVENKTIIEIDSAGGNVYLKAIFTDEKIIRQRH